MRSCRISCVYLLLDSVLVMSSEEASGSGATPVVTAVNLDERTMAAIISGVVSKLQETRRDGSGGGEMGS